jgi:endoglucanase
VVYNKIATSEIRFLPGVGQYIPADSIVNQGGADMRYIAPILAVFIFCASVTAANIAVTYNINTDVNRMSISKYIYGGNGQSDSYYTVQRSGGNRLTAYNWENNYSNAGADYGPYSNDNFMVWSQPGIPSSEWLVPGRAITYFRDSCVTNKQDSIVTLQMAGYVSADGSGNVTLPAQAAPSSRFKKVVFAKGAAFCNPPGSPVTTDANVYMDEFVNFLVSRYGRAGEPNGVKFYCMDNEPDIWSDGAQGATHPEVHPADPCCVEYKDKSVAISLAVKNVDPNAQMLGPVSYGFSGYLTFQGASDWPSQQYNNYDPNWFLSYYLDKMEANSVAASKRLLDVLDVHWYPEARNNALPYPDGNRITEDVNTNQMYNARMQAPRTLWDTGYVYPNGEISWINKSWNLQYLPIIPKLKKTISNYYPDTNLAITEYDYGGKDHWSGGIAFTDVLGIFGKHGVYIANYWGNSGTYLNAAFKMYRNYDNANSTFGDTEVYSTMSNNIDSSIYASVFNGYTCELHLIVINKNINNAITGTFNITSPQNFTSGSVWKFDNNSSNITATTAISTITNNSFTYTIPATTVCHMVLQADPPYWDMTGPFGVSDCHVNLWDLDGFAASWLSLYDFVYFADFAQEWGM